MCTTTIEQQLWIHFSRHIVEIPRITVVCNNRATIKELPRKLSPRHSFNSHTTARTLLSEHFLAFGISQNRIKADVKESA